MRLQARELYPDAGGWFSSYDPIVEALGNVVIRVDQKDYQGDTWVLYNNDGQYSYLCFGWGSCSGCDRLQGCDTYEEVDELIAELKESIIHFDSLDEARTYFNDEARKFNYSWHYQEFKEFMKGVNTYLEGQT